MNDSSASAYKLACGDDIEEVMDGKDIAIVDGHGAKIIWSYQPLQSP